jgi:dipeptidyl aminopeptidase/acylaminoacyl peptidase
MNVARASKLTTAHVIFAAITCFFFTRISVAARMNNGHTVTLDDLLELRNESYPQQLSPDGKWLAYSKGSDGRRDLWLVATRPGSTPRKLGRGVLPVWSPDGKQLAYYSDQSGSFQLWKFNVEADHSEQVTRVSGGINPDKRTLVLGFVWDPMTYSWSPNATRLVFASQVKSSVDADSIATRAHSPSPAIDGVPLILTGTTPIEWTMSGIFSKAFPNTLPQFYFWEKGDHTKDSVGPPQQTLNQLFVVDVINKSVGQLTHDALGYFDPEWSPDGRKIVCASSEQRYLNYGSLATNLYIIDVTTGAKTKLTNDSNSKWMPSWSPDGKYIAYSEAQDLGIRSVSVISSTGGLPHRITSQLDRSVLQYRWYSDSKSIIVQYIDGVDRPIARINVETEAAERLSGYGAASRSSLSVSKSGVIAWQQSDPADPLSIHILDLSANTGDHVVLAFNPQVKAWDLGTQEVIHWRNSRGDDLQGILIKPVGYQLGHRYPVIVDTYPITANGFKLSPMFGNQGWAARGYAVFMAENRAPHFWAGFLKSEAYTQAGKGPNGWNLTVDDVMSGVDELIHRGVADPNRMCLYGFSNGGGTVNYLVTRTNRFKCAVSVAGAMTDWVRQSLQHSDSSITAFEGGTSLWDDPDAYIRLSAVFHLNNVQTPMLLAVGDKDGDFLLDTIEMYNGLRQLGRNVTLLRYPDQGHGFTGAAMKDFWRRENAFFDKYLGP